MIKIKPIIPSEFKDVSEKYFTKAVEETINKADDEFKKTYRTWGNKPSFKKQIKPSSRKITGSTLTTDKGSKTNPYPFVERGTKVRYATMTPNFRAKTTPGVIGSGGGAGGVLYIDKRRPRPGIEARGFEAKVEEKIEPIFDDNVIKALKQTARASGHSL